MSQHVTLINPPLISQRNDPHTGIIFMPFVLAYLNGFLKANQKETTVIDALGQAPWTFRKLDGNQQIQGLDVEGVLRQIPAKTDVIFLYFSGVVAYKALAKLASHIGKRFNRPMILVENSQAVTSASVSEAPDQFLSMGFDVLLFGDPELNALDVLDAIAAQTPIPQQAGIIAATGSKPFHAAQTAINKDLDQFGFADWSDFPIENYWDLGYAHGPFEGPYLPLLTSRGCPVNCQFCVIPATNKRRWRSRSPGHVVAEIEHLYEAHGVRDFHIEDVNPTVKNQRILDLCDLLKQKNLPITFKFVSGTKIETMRLETIQSLGDAGCSYISFSPETGSQKLLKKMDKPFDHELALEMTTLMHRLGIKSQACFVLGFPGEDAEDVARTKTYIKRLAKAGVDEIAQFIVTPIPGTPTYLELKGYKNFSDMTFSPTWREDYKTLARRRILHYAYFFWIKVMYHPFKTIAHIPRIVRGRFQTKFEQAIYRLSTWKFRRWRKQR